MAAAGKKLFSLKSPHGAGGVFFCWQRTSGGFLATTGYDQLVTVYNRHAEVVDQVRLPGMCCSFGWDKDGNLLAAITDKSSDLFLWDANSQRSQLMDTGIRDPLNVLIWAKNGQTLAIGSYRGNLMLYNHKTARRVPVIGKHSKAITCGSWSDAGLLALGSEDRTLSISNSDGDTLRVATLRAEPSNVQFSEMKQDERRATAGVPPLAGPSGPMAGSSSALGNENTVSLIVGGKTLYLFNLYDPENPVELAFQARYGSIVEYEWFGDGYILIGFSMGYFVVISTHMKEIGQELFQVKNHKDSLTGIAISKAIDKAASCGDNTIKVHELHDLKDTSGVITLDDERGLEHLEWSEDGQLLAVSTTKGNVHVYLSRMPLLGTSCQTRVAYLTSLLEVSISSVLTQEGSASAVGGDMNGGTTTTTTIATEVEPAFMALGPYHLALGMNNRAWFYSLGDSSPSLPPTAVEFLLDREYLSTVRSMHLNSDYCAVRFEDGKLQLHTLEASSASGLEVSGTSGDEDFKGEERKSRLFPDPSGRQDVVSCHALTNDFLIYGTDMGTLVYFYLEEWCSVSEFRHGAGIKDLAVDPNGIKIVFIDVKSNGYVYNPVNNDLVVIRGFPEHGAKKVLWDSSVTDRDIFAVFDSVDNTLHTFLVKVDDVEEGGGGASCRCLGKTKVPSGQVPVLLFGGEVSLQTQSGKLVRLTLSTHEVSPNMTEYTDQELREVIDKNVALGRLGSAWTICQVLGDKEAWESLGKAALRQLDVEVAIRVFRHIGDVGMVWSLEKLREVEDKKVLCGHVALTLGDHNLAQTYYLQSSMPVEALNMRRDLLQWDQALHLANKLAQEQIPYISKEYGQQLEFTGAYSEALSHYERGLVKVDPGSPHQDKLSKGDEQHNLLCLAGIARTSLRCGQLRRGLELCNCEQLRSNKVLQRECADVLEQMKQWAEAANLYEKAAFFDKAAYLYIKLKDWAKIGKLLPHISSPKIQMAYARAKEADHKYSEAVAAYEAARDFDNAVRIHLDHLKDPESAVKLVKATKSIEGAKMVARFFLKLGDFSSAIRFLVMSKCVDEAFQLAKQHAKMDLFAEIIDTGDVATMEDYISIALYFESERNSLQAGRFYYKAGEHSKALRHLLKAAASGGGESDSEALNLAIEVVGASGTRTGQGGHAGGNNHLAHQLIDYLLGETDGVPKDAKFLFRLYMARGQYKEAAKTAVIIAREEQAHGNYRNAHDVLFNMHQELVAQRIPVQAEMRSNLMLLHSYVLARQHVKRGDHLRAARMLLRVANNISRFPAHTVPILTSTVIECQRAGLLKSAFNYAAVLMRPENRQHVDEKYRKKIEGIVRRRPAQLKAASGGTEEPLPALTECPFCQGDVPESELFCGQCKNNLPFCVVTGYHVVASDLTMCPSCKFPGFMSEMSSLAERDEACPMCGETLSQGSLKPINASQISFGGGQDGEESDGPGGHGENDEVSSGGHFNGESGYFNSAAGSTGPSSTTNSSNDFLSQGGNDNPHPLSAASSRSEREIASGFMMAT